MHTRIGNLEHDVHIYKMVILYIIYFIVSYLHLMILYKQSHICLLLANLNQIMIGMYAISLQVNANETDEWSKNKKSYYMFKHVIIGGVMKLVVKEASKN